MNYEITGRVQSVGEIQQFNKFKKVSFVIETEEKYPQVIQLELHNDNAEKSKGNLLAGQLVKVNFNIRGRKWEDKVFNNLVAWNFQPIENTQETFTKPDDDLPF